MSTSLTLYEIEENRLALLDTLDMVESDEAKVAILKDIALAEAGALAKRDAVIAFRQMHLRMAEAARAEANRLSDLAASIESKIQNLDTYLVRVIQEFVPEPKKGARKLEGTLGVLSLKKNPDSCEITDETQIPARFMVTPPPPAARPDKVAIKEALQSGEDVPGADLRYGEFRLEVK